jgi:hypothetical protein
MHIDVLDQNSSKDLLARTPIPVFLGWPFFCEAAKGTLENHCCTITVMHKISELLMHKRAQMYVVMTLTWQKSGLVFGEIITPDLQDCWSSGA